LSVFLRGSSARKRAAEALRLRKARLSLALQAGRIGSWRWTPEGNRITLPATPEDALGLRYDARIAPSAAFFELVRPGDRARHHAVFDEAGRTGHNFHNRYRVGRPATGPGAGWKSAAPQPSSE